MRARHAMVSTALMMVLIAGSAAAQTGATTILDRVRINPRRTIDFHAMVLPESVYVGQQATYQVAVLLSAEARSRLRRNPEFLPPELRGLLAYELGTPTRVAPRDYGGGVFEAHVFQRALFPVTDGPQVVPAPQLTYSLPQSSSYFSREERFMVRAESASFVVRPLPIADRPEDFTGAVGTFTAAIRIDTITARVGDPLVFTLRVQGTGNVKLLPRPVIELDWASTVPGTERIQVDSSGALIRGSKEFDWILTPTRSGRVRIPAQRYSYFDPYREAYATAESNPVELPVSRGTLATVEEGETTSALPLRTTVTPASPIGWRGRGLPPRSWWVWLLLAAVAPLPALWLRRRAASSAHHTASAGPRAVAMTPEARHDARDAVRRARRTLIGSLATRFGQTPQALVSRTALMRTLRRGGVTRETTRDTLALLDQLDELGFSREGDEAPHDSSVVDRSVRDVLTRVEREAIERGRSITTTIGTAVLLFGAVHGFIAVPLFDAHALTTPVPPIQVTAPVAGAPRSDADRAAQVEAARVAYERRAFADAAERFSALVRAMPVDADLLVNWGTAAWASGDTVSAVIAWQRASRLQPFAADVQQRVALLPSGARGGIADVPPVPVAALWRTAFVLWIIGWVVLTWSMGRTGVGDWLPRVRAAVAAILIAALAAAGTAWWGARALDGSTLAVVVRPETLRIAPGTDADAMGGVTTGDVVRIEESRELWERVHHADGRRGWLPHARLVMLEAHTLPSVRR